ncbi:MAG: glycosyltransferase family 4 protein [Armatimonadetes bacterium]|nr:glycosyltransferase family 4 protein [Armatimonadota bacterium]
MRIVVHDYSGHAFPVQLSRELARRGHQVLHLYSSSFTTPQGPLAKRPDDPETFQPEPIALAERVDKGNLLKRRTADLEHGTKAVQRIAAFKPEVILSGNTPLDAQYMLMRHAASRGVKFVFWVQDLIGIAAKRLLASKWMGAGRFAGQFYFVMERKLLERSSKVVLISEDFRLFLPPAVRNAPNVEVVENWALLDEIPLREKVNPWSTEKGFTEGLNFLYSGTLGMKHNPELLVQLAKELQGKGRMIVASEGDSINFLKQRMLELQLDNLHLLPFQPFECLPDMLGAADVLVGILEPSAGVFSVPSKVLTYLCAGRPILLAVPKENLAARIVSQHDGGLVVEPGDTEGFLAAARTLIQDAGLREAMGKNAHAYAEKTFDIETITDKFERILKT